MRPWDPDRLEVAEPGRKVRPKAVARTHTYAMSWTSHDCAYSTPSTRSKPDRLNAAGLMPISRTCSSVGGVGDRPPLESDRPARCSVYDPGSGDRNRRTGAERWPWLS